MTVEIGIVGKPNVGKSTFFEAATMAGAEIANYPFTTIKANRGIAHVRSPCVCRELGVSCEPRNSVCIDGTRLVPIELLDVAGLVPDAHAGKGLGNQFLDDLRQAHALVHVVDISGSADAEGNPLGKGSHDPISDVAFLCREIDHWFLNIIMKDWTKISRTSESLHRKVEELLADRVSGLGINIHHITDAVHHLGLDPSKPTGWKEEDLMSLAVTLRKRSKPMMIAGNKADRLDCDELKQASSRFGGELMVPTYSEMELALRRADKAGLISYMPGDPGFEVTHPESLSEAQKKGLIRIEEVMKERGPTNIQTVLEKAAFELLDLIVVYPVEDEHKYTDHDGKVLPDAFLVRRGTTARELAYKVHTDLGEKFVRAVDCRKDRAVAADHPLENNDVIKIHAGR